VGGAFLLLLLVLLLPVGPTAPAIVGSTGTHVGLLTSDLGGTPGWATLGGSENRSGYTTSLGATVDQTVWEACPGSGPVRSGPVVSADRVYVSTNSGTLYALNRSAGGRVVWSQFVGASPSTADDGGPLLLVGSAAGTLSALVASNGSIAWARPLPGGVAQGVAVVGGVAYVATTNGTVLALEASDGSLDWSVSVGAAVSGAVAVEDGSVYLATSNGTVVALSASNGALRWERPVGGAVDSAPAVSEGSVVVGDGSGAVTALSASDGAVLWNWSARSLLPYDAISSTPSVSPGRVVVSTDLGEVVALNASDGQLLWNVTAPYSGYPVESSPVTTPGFVYAVGGATRLEAIELATGRTAWSTTLDGGAASQSPPAVVGGEVVIGDDAGCVVDIGSPAGVSYWPVAGSVRDPSGAPVDGAQVNIGFAGTTTGPDGTFELELSNGTYTAYVYRTGFVEAIFDLTIAGPRTNLSIVLEPLPLFPLYGTVIDSHSGHGIAGAVVRLQGADGYLASAVTDGTGAFRILAGNGSDSLQVDPPAGYQSAQMSVTIPGAPVRGLVVPVDPSGLSISASDPYRLDLWLPIGGLAIAGLGLWVVDVRERRRAAGLSPEILSTFGRYVAMRLLLIPGEVAAVLVLLYAFGTFLPAAAIGGNLCQIAGAGCATCSWSSPACVANAFGSGFGTFLERLVTGNWGFASYGALYEPAVQFLNWWLPDSVELALVALALTVVIAYPVSILSGARPDSPVDVGSRLGSTVGLLVPSFLVLLTVYGIAYSSFSQALGDSPYGLTPTPIWLQAHGGVPSWMGIAGSTSPTGFPIVDGLLHQDWAFAGLAAAKTLLQAAVIALIYVAIYLRFLRGAVTRALAAPSVVAARARGLSEGAILWRHAGRRLLPTYLLVFGSTFPAYIGAQALVEAVSNDTGLGTLLLTEIVQAPSTGFGFAHSVGPSGNFYQVAVFLVVLLVLGTRLVADVVARYLDPRLLDEAER
jgi:outer membrane protein assembly factor BamB/ABC-type dipeptide/oligopeptide/nickel transport system permease component